MRVIYNYDFCIAALLIEIVIIGFFLVRKKLPIRQNRLFLMALVIQFVVAFANILSSIMDNDYTKYSVLSLYIVNLIYFVFYEARTAVFFQYTLAAARMGQETSSRATERLLMLPFVAYEIIALTNQWTGLIFEIRPDGRYQNGWGFKIIYYIFFYYLVLTLVTVFLYRSKLSRAQFISILIYCGLLLCGNFVRNWMPYVLTMDAFTQMAIVVIYLSLQNPDYYIDKTTTLFDVDAFLAIVGEWIGRGREFDCFCFFIDQYDDMRSIYDVTVMNRALREIGRWLAANKKNRELFYFGDGRFVSIACGDEGAEEYGRRVADRFSGPWSVEGTNVHLSVRSGLLPASVSKSDPVQLMELVSFFFSEKSKEKTADGLIDERLVERMQRARSVEKAIGRAIDNDSVEVWYQPLYSYHTGKFDSAEALVRITDEELGRIMPDEFIPRAERTGQIVLLGRQIFRKVCAFIRDEKLREKGIAYLHVNLSPIQCMDERLAGQLSQDMEEYGIDPMMIEFEITETTTMETEEFHRSLQSLSRLGRGLALDDYGSGATNLNRMLEWNVNMVKIDKNIVSAFIQRNEVRVVENLVRMFHDRNLKVVAEGIETREMSDMMEIAYVDLAQGYYYAKPMPQKDYLEFLEWHR